MTGHTYSRNREEKDMHKNEYPLKHPRGSSPPQNSGQPEARRRSLRTIKEPVVSDARGEKKETSMISARMIWTILQRHAPRRQWIHSEDLYKIVALYGGLDGKDLQPQSSRSKSPRWRIRVRSVLANRLKRGRIRWRERARQNDQAGEIPS
jgi:hypothetical protein